MVKFPTKKEEQIINGWVDCKFSNRIDKSHSYIVKDHSTILIYDIDLFVKHKNGYSIRDSYKIEYNRFNKSFKNITKKRVKIKIGGLKIEK